MLIAIAVSQCQHIVYAVRSKSEQETSEVVTMALEQHRATKKGRDSDYTPIIPRDVLDISGGGFHVTLLEKRVCYFTIFTCRYI